MVFLLLDQNVFCSFLADGKQLHREDRLVSTCRMLMGLHRSVTGFRFVLLLCSVLRLLQRS
jgi:hypothetical protein